MTHGDARRQVAAQTKSANNIFIPAGLSAGEWMGDGGRARGARRYHAAAAPARWQGQCTIAQPAKTCAGRRVARRGGRIKLRSHDRRHRGRRRIDALPRSRSRGCAAALPLVHHRLALAPAVVPPGKAPLNRARLLRAACLALLGSGSSFQGSGQSGQYFGASPARGGAQIQCHATVTG